MVAGCCARWRDTYGNAGKDFSNELQAGSDKWCFFIRRVVLLWLMVGNMIPYEHKVLYVKEGVNFLKILLFL